VIWKSARPHLVLQDGGTGASLWSNRWDRPSGDIFAVQNEVSDGVISTLGGRGLLTSLAAVAARRKGPSDLEAYDLFALGMADFYKGGEEGFAKSIKFFDAAIAKDQALGQGYHVNQTPTTIFHANGQTFPYAGVMNWEILKQFLDQLLSQK